MDAQRRFTFFKTHDIFSPHSRVFEEMLDDIETKANVEGLFCEFGFKSTRSIKYVEV